jgi:hypothetical protein
MKSILEIAKSKLLTSRGLDRLPQMIRVIRDITMEINIPGILLTTMVQFGHGYWGIL